MVLETPWIACPFVVQDICLEVIYWASFSNHFSPNLKINYVTIS